MSEESEEPKCVLCQQRTWNEDGSPVGVVLCYQVINGKVQLAKEIILHEWLYEVHKECLEALR